MIKLFKKQTEILFLLAFKKCIESQVSFLVNLLFMFFLRNFTYFLYQYQFYNYYSPKTSLNFNIYPV